ncbi:MAG: hypothetical protein HY403_02485 [Elusimicrobia bacterium]|nr:hypothetical protein [Elusimicrobiota bacterium]
MCSIAGAVNGGNVERMLEIQAHRAPDESGVYRGPGIELGMGRLKILDLKSEGLCPYREDGLVLSYNGEIYNYIELRRELRGLGWRFRTTSDIEVLLKCWRQWGVRMFDKLNGMFAFALYDSRKKKLILARDIAGEKPLYYYARGDRFLFASEAKAFNGQVALTPRRDRFFDVFQHCRVTTLWRDVYEIPAAHYLSCDLATGERKLRPYWEFKKRSINLKTAREELEALLVDAIKIRTRSDVPYGLYYSGGIDSTLISALFNFRHKFYFDDARNWKANFYNEIEKVVWHLDFPVGSLSAYPLWKLAEMAGKQVKVVLSGEGADELFGGYVRYLPIAREYEMNKKYPSYQYLFNKFYSPYIDGFSRITARSDDVEFVREQVKPYFAMFDDPISAMGFADFKLVMPSLLQMGDRMAGAFGIENRCPFLDRRVIEFGFSLPPELKINGLDQKVILRNILLRRGLAAPLRFEKSGLSIRFNKWLGRKDWDRGVYVSLLKDKWDKIYRQRRGWAGAISWSAQRSSRSISRIGQRAMTPRSAPGRASRRDRT